MKARQKIQEGKDWRGTANVVLGGDTQELTHRLLTETEFFEVRQSIDLQKLQEYAQEEESEAEKRVKELQQKEELSDAEEEELEELSVEVQQKQAEIEEALGENAYQSLMDAGKKALVPSEEDVTEAMNLPVEEQKRIFGRIPNGGKPVFRDLLKSDMEEMVEEQPYPIKYLIGQQAFVESVKLLGKSKQRN